VLLLLPLPPDECICGVAVLVLVLLLLLGDPWDPLRRTLSGRFVSGVITDAVADLIFKLLQVCV